MATTVLTDQVRRQTGLGCDNWEKGKRRKTFDFETELRSCVECFLSLPLSQVIARLTLREPAHAHHDDADCQDDGNDGDDELALCGLGFVRIAPRAILHWTHLRRLSLANNRLRSLNGLEVLRELEVRKSG